MKTSVVGQPGSQLHGLSTKCCKRRTKPGQVVFWALTAPAANVSWRQRAFVLHADCMATMVANAPDGAPVRPPELAAEMAALRALAVA